MPSKGQPWAPTSRPRLRQGPQSPAATAHQGRPGHAPGVVAGGAGIEPQGLPEGASGAREEGGWQGHPARGLKSPPCCPGAWCHPHPATTRRASEIAGITRRPAQPGLQRRSAPPPPRRDSAQELSPVGRRWPTAPGEVDFSEACDRCSHRWEAPLVARDMWLPKSVCLRERQFTCFPSVWKPDPRPWPRPGQPAPAQLTPALWARRPPGFKPEFLEQGSLDLLYQNPQRSIKKQIPTRKAEAGGSKFDHILGNLVRPCLKRKNKKGWAGAQQEGCGFNP